MSNSSFETPLFKRGPGGRPTREEAERRHQALLETAGRQFLAGGFSGTSIDAIAAEAGVAKRFIYARYADKGALFVAAIGRLIESRHAVLAAFELPDGPAEQGLIAFGRLLRDMVLSAGPLNIFQTLATEAARSPELVQQFIAAKRGSAIGAIGRVLEAYAQRGDITVDEPQFLAEHFFILVAGLGQRMATIGIFEPPEVADRRLAAAIRLFLHGCRTVG